MITGYISVIKHQNIEQSLRQANPKGKAFEFSIGDRWCFFFHSSPNKFNKLAYYDESSLVLCDGIPVRKSSLADYEVIEKLNKEDINKGIDDLLNTIISNVSLIYFRTHESDAHIILSSNRASAGKIYYRSLKDGIAFSSDFTELLKFGEFNLDEKGLFSIVRYGACPAPFTISRNIQAVPPAHYVVFNLYGKHVRTQSYFKFDFPETNKSDLIPFSRLLDSSTYILDNLEASILLSGGIDSTVLAQKLSQHSDRRLRSYNLSFGDRDPETPYARDVACKTGSQLEIFNMESDIVLDTIIEATQAYSHPFNDSSIIPTYYLMARIAHYENEALIIDGTGGDEDFGLFNSSQLSSLRTAFGLPKFIKSAIFNLRKHSNQIGTMNKFDNTLWRISECHREDINLVPLALCPLTTPFRNDTGEYDEEISDTITRLYTNLLHSSLHNRQLNATVTVAKLSQVSCGMWCAKTHNLKTAPNLQTVYPFLWRDMLEEQGKLSWSAKINKETKKLPLKQLLEKEFPIDFIYRRKHGFGPPFETWFSNVKVYELLCDTLLSRNTAIDSIVDRVQLEKILQKLPHSTNWPGTFHNFLWGILYTELWIKANTRR